MVSPLKTQGHLILTLKHLNINVQQYVEVAACQMNYMASLLFPTFFPSL